MSALRMLISQRWLIWNLVLLDFRVRFAGSRLGLLWMMAGPLPIFGAFLILFGRILKVQSHQAMSGVDYGLLVAAGLLPWIGFSESVTRGTSSVLAQRKLLKSRVFPIELIPVTAVCVGLFGQLCSTILFLIVSAFYGTLGLTILLLPGLLLLQVMLTVGGVWFLSCVNILYRDTGQVVSLVMILLLFLSPIAYTQQMLPEGLTWVVWLNPFSYLVEGYRSALLSGYDPNLWYLAALAVMAIVAMSAGHRYFMRLRRWLPDYV